MKFLRINLKQSKSKEKYPTPHPQQQKKKGSSKNITGTEWGKEKDTAAGC